jgi:hypothetical protein
MQRTRTVGGVTISGLTLEEAVEAGRFWAEGYDPSSEPPPQELEEGEERPVASRPREQRQPPVKQMSEEEIVAMNNRALAWLESQTAGLGGGGLRSFEAK